MAGCINYPTFVSDHAAFYTKGHLIQIDQLIPRISGTIAVWLRKKHKKNRPKRRLPRL
jgi:hypothetical protein